MKRLALLLLCFPSISFAADTEIVCDVTVCNKIERFTLDPWDMIQDKMGEVCEETTVYKKDAVVDKILSSDTRWYQGSFNPTKASVTRVKSVHKCYEASDE